MKKNYKLNQINCSLKTIKKSISLSLFLVSGIMSAQTTYTFVAAGATGSAGPTPAQVTTAYGATNLNGLVTASAGIQSFTVPTSGAYTIKAYGARGGGNIAGLGASMQGDFTLTAGTVIKVLVGQQGGSQNGSHGSGGGGSFVTYTNNTVLVVAGGGGGRGASQTGTQVACNGTTSINGQTPIGGAPAGTGGGGGASASGATGGTSLTPGANSGGSTWASGGGGFYTNGGMYSSGSLFGGRAFLNGGLGGDPGTGALTAGGFGGGGGAGDRGAGGGGYSGGAGGTQNTDGGGGGGSMNNGANQINQAGVNAGNGFVVFTLNCTPGATPTNTTSVANQNICSGNTTTLNVVGTATLNWYSTPSSTTVLGSGASFVTPTLAIGSYTYYAASTNTCGEGSRAAVTVSVNATPTVAAVSNASLICAGFPASLTASGANTFTWNTTATTTVIAISPTVTTSYTVTGTTNGCNNSVVITQSVSPCTGIIGNQSLSTAINIYPNPNNGDFTIELNNGMDKAIEVIDVTGRIVVKQKTSNGLMNVNISNLSNGVYYVKIQTNNTSSVVKVVKQ